MTHVTQVGEAPFETKAVLDGLRNILTTIQRSTGCQYLLHERSPHEHYDQRH